MTYFFASLPKAVFDYIYLKPLSDANQFKQLLFESRFNWDVFQDKDKKVFEDIVFKSCSPKMIKVLNYLKKEKII